MTAPIAVEQPAPKKRPSPLEMAILGGLGASAAADYASTLGFMKRGGYELNPVMRPIVQAGPVPLALVEGGVTALTSLASHELKKRGSKFWWVPPALGIVGHGVAALHNQKVAR